MKKNSVLFYLCTVSIVKNLSFASLLCFAFAATQAVATQQEPQQHNDQQSVAAKQHKNFELYWEITPAGFLQMKYKFASSDSNPAEIFEKSFGNKHEHNAQKANVIVCGFLRTCLRTKKDPLISGINVITEQYFKDSLKLDLSNSLQDDFSFLKQFHVKAMKVASEYPPPNFLTLPMNVVNSLRELHVSRHMVQFFKDKRQFPNLRKFGCKLQEKNFKILAEKADQKMPKLHSLVLYAVGPKPVVLSKKLPQIKHLELNRFSSAAIKGLQSIYNQLTSLAVIDAHANSAQLARTADLSTVAKADTQANKLTHITVKGYKIDNVDKAFSLPKLQVLDLTKAFVTTKQVKQLQQQDKCKVLLPPADEWL